MKKRPWKTWIFADSYRTTDVGLVKATVDAPCPTQVGDNNWADYYGNPVNQPGMIIRPCPVNEGVIVGTCIYKISIMVFAGRKIETITNQSGTKNYKEVFDVQSFSPISTSVASSSSFCSFDCRCNYVDTLD